MTGSARSRLDNLAHGTAIPVKMAPMQAIDRATFEHVNAAAHAQLAIASIA